MSDLEDYPKDAWKGLDGRMRDSAGRICTPGGDRFYDGPILWNPPTAQIPDDPREALPGLWAYAGEVWNCIWIVFHTVLSSIAGDAIERHDHRVLGDWVRNAELLVRRIILIAALALELPPPNPRVGRSTRPHASIPRRPGSITPDNPETWRTSFQLFPSQRERTRTHRRRRSATPRMPTARGYALRIEAMRRVLARQPVYALRAARRLQRLAIANRTANQRVELSVAPFSYHPSGRTTGKGMIEEPMRIAQPLVDRGIARWNLPLPEPG